MLRREDVEHDQGLEVALVATHDGAEEHVEQDAAHRHVRQVGRLQREDEWCRYVGAHKLIYSMARTRIYQTRRNAAFR